MRISSAVFKSSIGFRCQRHLILCSVAIWKNIAVILASPTSLWHPFGDNQHQKGSLYPQQFVAIQIFFLPKCFSLLLYFAFLNTNYVP